MAQYKNAQDRITRSDRPVESVDLAGVVDLMKYQITSEDLDMKKEYRMHDFFRPKRA